MNIFERGRDDLIKDNPLALSAIRLLQFESDIRDLKTKSEYLDKILNKKYNYNFFIPEGGFFAFLDISKKNLSSDEFAFNLLESYNVAVTPGIIFGKNWNNFIRISMSTNIKNFKKGIDLLGLFLNAKK